ncbi:AI-2E family transporter [Canibacter sp. lx-45]|uniref:AI-2E family transporter n=1 Tax=Canibacter zhuwentaonis TaxID=2837491 RepID=UPI001BDD0556|nr:AI-2E family transporter [Canibacter zhuwentaonis]MBT1035565.1 AI-2E family transporter [Canibacter zhuwentaonis]
MMFGKIFRTVGANLNSSSKLTESELAEHPDIKRVDMSRLDSDTREMYREARDLSEEHSELIAKYGDGSSSVKVRNPFKIGLIAAMGVLVTLAASSLLQQASSVIVYVVGALFIALGLDPLVRMLERRGVKRGLGVAIVFLGLFAIIGGIFAIVIPVIIKEVSNLVEQAPTYYNNLVRESWFMNLDRAASKFFDLEEIVGMGRDYIANPGNISSFANGALQVGLGIASAITATMIVLILSLYFLASMRSIKRGFYSLVPKTSRARVIDITEQVSDSVGGYIAGQATIAFTNAVLGFIMMTIVGVPFAVLVAVGVFFLALIPLVGALTATVLVVIVAFFNSPMTALIAGVYYLIYMQLEAYVLTPRIMNKAVDIPGAMVVVGVLTGGTLFGVLGALMAIPVTASIMMIVKQVWIPIQDKR